MAALGATNRVSAEHVCRAREEAAQSMSVAHDNEKATRARQRQSKSACRLVQSAGQYLDGFGYRGQDKMRSAYMCVQSCVEHEKARKAMRANYF